MNDRLFALDQARTPVPVAGESSTMLMRTFLLISGLLLTAFSDTAIAQSDAPGTSNGATAGGALLTLQMPALPDPVRVVLTPATTALLVSDMVAPNCTTQPKCTGLMMPALAALLAQARKASVYVVYSTQAQRVSNWLPKLAPAPGDPIVVSHGQDRFYETDLDKMLKAKGIATLIITGWKISGSVLYTSVGATLRDYTVVIPEDASLAATDYETAIGLFQILNQSSANAANEPLKAKASTLSRTDMITFQ
jgi:nicotinamidase-related amidase